MFKITREVQSKMVRYYDTPTRMLKFKRLTIPSAIQDLELLEAPYTAS